MARRHRTNEPRPSSDRVRARALVHQALLRATLAIVARELVLERIES